MPRHVYTLSVTVDGKTENYEFEWLWMAILAQKHMAEKDNFSEICLTK